MFVLSGTDTIGLGEFAALQAVLLDDLGDTVRGRPVAWTSTDESVFEVYAHGLAVARAPGSAFIVARAEGVADSALLSSRVRFASVAAGSRHTCSSGGSGLSFCWGDNTFNQLGDGGTIGIDQDVPVLVVGRVPLTGISAGGEHTCGLDEGGIAFCWGDNNNGQTGTIVASIVATPAVVSGMSFRALRAGGLHTCAVTVADSIYCWGDNTFGQSGAGVGGGVVARPTRVAGSGVYLAVTAGPQHTCALATNGAAWCWGRNQADQLGDSSGSDASSPQLVHGSVTFVAVAAGGAHTCAIGADSIAYCWGANSAGQTGDSASSGGPGPPVPRPVDASPRFATIVAGAQHSCALTRVGLAYCWGANATGQLGRDPGTTPSSAVPLLVSGGLVFASLTAGAGHTCGLTAADEVYCWGSNGDGRLGSGSGVAHSGTPLQVFGPP